MNKPVIDNLKVKVGDEVIILKEDFFKEFWNIEKAFGVVRRINKHHIFIYIPNEKIRKKLDLGYSHFKFKKSNGIATILDRIRIIKKSPEAIAYYTEKKKLVQSYSNLGFIIQDLYHTTHKVNPKLKSTDIKNIERKIKRIDAFLKK